MTRPSLHSPAPRAGAFRCLMLAALLLAPAGAALARDWTMAEATLQEYDEECFLISSRKGWQRVELLDEPIAFDFRTGSRDRWTVDAARYDPVTYMGHGAADEAALAPYAQYKYRRDLPFGRMLARADGGPALDVGSDPSYDEAQRVLSALNLDFRINDTGLGDNQGSVEVCILY
ncbi:hypothetical protein [Oceanicola sp. S124]|uniref:hypothetical protein n=1 Tax=Oceanicola sp. S124 TaxID=1042378 RepID=UPI0002558150|nr:hypothetical protein [Oceanicola sp. S124]